MPGSAWHQSAPAHALLLCRVFSRHTCTHWARCCLPMSRTQIHAAHLLLHSLALHAHARINTLRTRCCSAMSSSSFSRMSFMMHTSAM